MEIIQQVYVLCLAGLSALAGGIAVYVLHKLSKTRQSVESLQSQLNKSKKDLKGRLSNLEQIQVQMGQTLHSLDEKVDDWTPRIDRLEIRDSSYAPYHHAAKMVELGANASELSTSCGLSRAEADLVLWVNQNTTMKKVDPRNDDTDESGSNVVKL